MSELPEDDDEAEAEATAAEILTVEATAAHAGRRIDQALAEWFPQFSRAQIQQWIRAGLVAVSTGAPRNSDKLKGGERIELRVPAAPTVAFGAQAIALDIVYEDDDLLVLNKPAGLVVHPGAGNQTGTLLNALLHYAPALAKLPRAGIVHRLDKDTSGLMVVARSERARLDLIEQLQTHSLAREYLCVVTGVMIAGGTVDAPIGRHHHERIRMAVRDDGKPAVTHYRVQRRYRAHTLVAVTLESGRTHQIRVHMAHMRYPIVGDPVYGARLSLPKGASAQLVDVLRGFRRQALHATGLGLIHPITGEELHWQRPMPADMCTLINALSDDADSAGATR